MKMFKKLMAVVLTGALAVSMLTGCALSDAMAKNEAVNALNRAGKTSSQATDGYTHKYTEANEVTVDKTKYKLSDEAKKIGDQIKTIETSKEQYSNNGAVLDLDDEGITVDDGYLAVAVVAPSSSSADKWNKLAGDVNAVLEEAYCTGSTSTTSVAPHEIKVCVKKYSTKKASGDNGKSYDVYVFVAKDAE